MLALHEIETLPIGCLTYATGRSCSSENSRSQAAAALRPIYATIIVLEALLTHGRGSVSVLRINQSTLFFVRFAWMSRVNITAIILILKFLLFRFIREENS